MTFIKSIAFIAALAPVAAYAQSCEWNMYWDSNRQMCVTFQEITANTVQDAGSETWMQPYTDAAAEEIRSINSCEGCVQQR